MTLRLLHFCVAGMCWTALVIKVVDLARRPHERGLRGLCAILLALGVALTAGLPPVYAAIDHVTRIPNAAKLIQHLATIAACSGIGVLFVRLDRPEAAEPAARHRIRMAALVCATITVLFFLAPVDVSEPVYFADRYSAAPFVPQYMFLYLAVIALVCADIAVSAWRRGRRDDPVALRHGVRLLSASAVAAVAYAVFKGGYVVARWSGHTPPVREGAVSTPLALLAAALAIAGLIAPKAGTALRAVRRRIACYRTHRRLYPLWRDLRAAMPEIALRERRFFDIEYRLYRRVIEISDGILALPTARPSEVTTALADALAQELRPLWTETTLADETAWLVRVADAYRRRCAVIRSGGRTAIPALERIPRRCRCCATTPTAGRST